MLVVNQRLKIPLTELHFTFARSSGTAGQNVNKVNTKATLRWDVTNSPSLPQAVRERFLKKYRRRITTEGELVLQSQRFRDQGRNIADCLGKLREMISTVAVAPRPRKLTKPSQGSHQRRLRAKREKSEKKQSRRSPKMDD